VEPVLTAAPDDDYWGTATTTMPQQQNDHYDFWSTASALQHLTAGAADHHFQQQAADHDLTGWVQGFSDSILSVSPSSDNLWSLDDIWRMPQ
jgi:myb proto-oncogene protein